MSAVVGKQHKRLPHLVALTTSEPPRTSSVHLSNRIVMTPVSAFTFEATIISI